MAAEKRDRERERETETRREREREREQSVCEERGREVRRKRELKGKKERKEERKGECPQGEFPSSIGRCRIQRCVHRGNPSLGDYPLEENSTTVHF